MNPRNLAWAGGLLAVVVGMAGLSFAAVPLYQLFCAATGYGGTPKIGPAAAPGAVERTIVVQFNADADPNLPWRFRPAQPQIAVKLGEEQVGFYTARNLAAAAVSGTALYNVTPEKAAKYFHKTACFCFNAQTLGPGQEMQLPLSFWVDPAIAEDPNARDVRTITLSYTFYRSLGDSSAEAAAKAGPHVGGRS